MSKKDMVTIAYNAAPTAQKFHKSEALVKGLMGAIGSGKSVSCCADIIRLSHLQERNKHGKRMTRGAIIRNTVKELKNTTIKTFLDWFGDLGTMKWTDLVFTIEVNDVVCEILFLGLDRPDQLKALLSLELSWAWINEAREINEDTAQMVISRLGRYPAKKDGIECTNPTLLMDTNPPDLDHWWHRIFEIDKPSGWELFKQPSPLLADGSFNPLGENLENLPKGYYTTMMSGKSEDWLRVYRDGQYGFVQDGKPVYPEYNDNLHCIPEYEPDMDRPFICGGDNGRWSAVPIGQFDLEGRLVVFDECVSEDIGATEFGRLVKEYIQQEYPKFKGDIWLDPACNNRGQNSDNKNNTHYLIWKNNLNLPVRLAPTNKPSIVIEAVRDKLNTLRNGLPSLLITPRAEQLRKGLAGGYKYKRVMTSGLKYTDMPDKNKYSHVCDALAYMVNGSGAGKEIIGNSKFKALASSGKRFSAGKGFKR